MSRSIRDLRELICVSRLNDNNINADFDNNLLKGRMNYSSLYSDYKDPNLKCDSEKVKVKLPNSKTLGCSNVKKPLPNIKISFDNNLTELAKFSELITEELLSEWLCKTNIKLQEISEWAQNDNFFVNFTNFWLVELAADKRNDLFVMKYDIILKEITTGLIKNIFNVNMVNQITNCLVLIAFWEYSNDLKTSNGSYIFLDYLHILISERSDKYKSLLTNVEISTKNKQYIQLILTTRAFIIMSIWSSIIKFYMNIVKRDDKKIKLIEINMSSTDTMYRRLCMAICNEFIPTLQYWIERKYFNFHEYRDEQNRNLLIMAVSYNSILVLKYFIRTFDVINLINCPSDTGNSALHLAVCQGNLDIIKVLIEDGHANVNVTNQMCDNFTPLHMANIYGRKEIITFLIECGAFKGQISGLCTTKEDLAKENFQT